MAKTLDDIYDILTKINAKGSTPPGTTGGSASGAALGGALGGLGGAALNIAANKPISFGSAFGSAKKSISAISNLFSGGSTSGGGSGGGSPSGGGSGGGGSAAAAAAAIHPIAGIAVAATEAVAALIKFPFALKDFGNALLESQRNLAEFSGSMAGVFAQKDVFEAQQNQRIGEATAGSAGNLEEALEGFSTALEPIKVMFTNLVNNVLAGFIRFITPIMEFIKSILNSIIVGINEIIGVAEAIYNKLPGDDVKFPRLEKIGEEPVPRAPPNFDFFEEKLRPRGLAPARGF